MKKILISAIAIFLGFTFWGAGMAKLFYEHKFFGWIGPVWLIEELSKYGLGFYGTFIAYSQIIIGYLLVTNRYKLLGSIMMLPLIVNTLMVTISLNWQGTPYVLTFLLVLNLILLWQYRDFFRPLIDEGRTVPELKLRKQRTGLGHLVWLSGLALQLLAIPVSYLDWILACGIVLGGLILSSLSFKIEARQVEKVVSVELK